jgi:hypothetical protein
MLYGDPLPVMHVKRVAVRSEASFYSFSACGQIWVVKHRQSMI